MEFILGGDSLVSFLLPVLLLTQHCLLIIADCYDSVMEIVVSSFKKAASQVKTK